MDWEEFAGETLKYPNLHRWELNVLRGKARRHNGSVRVEMVG